MKIQVAKQDLDNALSVALTSISTTGSDLSTHCLFRPSPDDNTKAEVLTYNSRCFSRCPFVGTIEGDKPFTVEGKRLKKWMNAVPDVALTFESDGAVVKATAPGRGTQKFQSLNPDNWPYWDSLVEKAETTYSIDSVRLAAALDHARQFTSDQENRNPELCVCEARDGTLIATDKIAATFIQVSGLEKSSMRVHAKDAGSILSFLSTIEGEVEVFEEETNLFLRRKDGTIYGESRFQAKFPTFSQPPDEDMHWWELRVEDLKSGIPFLASGAAWEDNRLHFNRTGDGPISISMMSTAGSMTSIDIECVDSGKGDGAEDLPSDGFVLSHPLLTKVLAPCKDETVRFGINFRQKGGYIRLSDHRFQSEDGSGGDSYVTILAWLR